MKKKFVVLKKMTRKECPWLPHDIQQGIIVYLRSDAYGVCSETGVPVGFSPTSKYYFELPQEVLQEYIGYVFSLN